MVKSKKISPRKVPILNIYPIERATPESISESSQLTTFLYTETPKAIQEAIRTRKQVATLFQINNQDAYLEIEKRDWCAAIDKCIVYQSEKEQYELCTELQDIKIKIGKSKKELV